MMYLAALLLLCFCCVTHLYVLIYMQLYAASCRQDRESLQQMTNSITAVQECDATKT